MQQAVREVDDAIVSIRTYRDEREVRLRQVEATSGATRLARARYYGGVTTYLEVLDAERSLFSAQLEASTALQGQIVAIVNLYKALGGGWQVETPSAANGSSAGDKGN